MATTAQQGRPFAIKLSPVCIAVQYSSYYGIVNNVYYSYAVMNQYLHTIYEQLRCSQHAINKKNIFFKFMANSQKNILTN